MFWDKWIPGKYLVKSEICGVEVNFSEEGVLYIYTHLRNKNKKLEIASSGSSKDKAELPASIIKNKIPLVLIINGKGVIYKKINLAENAEQDFEEIARQNLPAISANDFYIQLYKQSDSTAFIAFGRKEQVDSVITELKEQKHDLAGIFLGVPAVTGMQPLWNNFNRVQTSLHQVELSNNVVDSITAKQVGEGENIKIEDIAFTPQHTLGFAGALSYLMQRPIARSVNHEIIQLENRHTEKNKFRFLMILTVAIAFALAAINVVFYTSYFDENNKLENELSVYQGKYEQINKLLGDYQKKKSLIENAGILNKNKLSEYADKVAKTIPDEVLLTEMYFNPKENKDESEDSLVTFNSKQLILKGNCNKSLIINEWVNVLKMQKFVKEVSLEKFAYNAEGLLPNYEIKLLTE